MSDTIKVYNRRAADYVDLAVQDAAAEVAGFLADVSKGARVLDLGCGPGHHAAVMAAAGLDVLAVDGSSEMVALAAQKPGVTAQLARFEDIADLGPVDGVWASFSLLHAPKADMPRHLAALHKICRKGAPLWMGMKLGSGEETDRIGRFYSYYSENELRGLLTEAGFIPGKAKLGAGKGLAGDISDYVVISARA